MKPDQNGNNNKKRNLFGLAQLILWALVATILVRGCTSSYENASVVEVPYTDFRQLVTQGAVDTVDFESGKYTFTLKEGFTYELPEEQQQTQNLMNALLPAPSAPQEVKYVTIPLAGVEDFELMQLLIDHNVTGSTKPADPSAYMITLLLSYVLPMLLILGVTIFLFRGIGGKGGMGGIGGIGGVGKANAKVYVEKKTGVTFQDVAGQDEAKESLQEIIDILHNPQKYTEIGAKLPKGALLVGPPGTGDRKSVV